jgi:hypothetical protein
VDSCVLCNVDPQVRHVTIGHRNIFSLQKDNGLNTFEIM